MDTKIKRISRVSAWRNKIADCWWRWLFFSLYQMCPADVSRLQQPGFWANYLQHRKCCMHCYVFKLLSKLDKLNGWYSFFKVRLTHGFIRFFGDLPSLIWHKTQMFFKFDVSVKWKISKGKNIFEWLDFFFISVNIMWQAVSCLLLRIKTEVPQKI